MLIKYNNTCRTKYLHRAFERYNDKKIDNINPYIFEPIGTVSSSLKALRVLLFFHTDLQSLSSLLRL